MTSKDRSGMVGLYIEGKWTAPAGGHYAVIDPATELPVGQAPEADTGQVLMAAAAARRAWREWADQPVATRAALVAQLGRVLLERVDELVDLVVGETGATATIAEPHQVRHALGFLTRWANVGAGDLVTPLPPFQGPGGRGSRAALVGAVVNRSPRGVVACITPFNYPLLCACAMAGPALVAGNAVVLKPAPPNPLAVFALGEAASEVGLPPGVLNIVGGRAVELGTALVDSDDVDMVSFTGSTAVGRQIASAAGQKMKRVLLELGGKGAAIVLEDADLESAVAGIATTWTRHAGQVCTAPTRVLAHRAVQAELVERLATVVSQLRVGDPRSPETEVGPLTTLAHHQRVEGYIRSAVADGGSLVAGHRHDQRGYFTPPTLIDGCRTDMRVVQEEVFGPVVAVLAPFDSPEEAITLANQSAYGLQDYIWSADLALAYEMATRLRTGYVDINTTARSPDAPFGGFGLSGMGRDGGRFSLEAYTEPQSILWTN